jgi:acylphosphatase
MVVNKQIFVSGLVQGVFYRESTRQMASELSLSGWVRNRRDGRVEVLVSGEKNRVENLIKWLKTGPKLAKVSTIEVTDLTSDAALQLTSEQQHHQQNEGFVIWPTK